MQRLRDEIQNIADKLQNDPIITGADHAGKPMAGLQRRLRMAGLHHLYNSDEPSFYTESYNKPVALVFAFCGHNIHFFI